MSTFVLDQDLHLHSMLSACSSDPEQTTDRILRHARENGLSTLCLTDHYWDAAVEGPSEWYAPQDFDHIVASRPLPTADGIRLMFGCETELRKDLTLGIPPARYDEFDFIVIPTTHLHMTGFTLSEEDATSLEARARLWVERLDAVLDMDLPFYKIGIAHLACGLLAPRPRENYLKTLNMIPTSQMERVFEKAAARGVGIEINMDDMKFSDSEADTVLRPFRVAKRQGCKFYTASDAHHPAHFAKYRAIMERAIALLELQESDKFQI